MRSFPSQYSRGFTLIEMIAAFVIFAIAVGALMQILTMSMNNARRSADETRAALWAQSLLDNVGIGERVEAGSTHGEFDRKYRWELQIDTIDPELMAAEVSQKSANAGAAQPAFAQSAVPVFGMPQIDLFHVVLTVVWGDNARERTAKFSTLRTANTDSANLQGFPAADMQRVQQGRPAPDGMRGRSATPAGKGR
ncbi:MAG: prepilin-type N-terminal cleavage/methylation domain-containing protein [Dokdonella sp.]